MYFHRKINRNKEQKQSCVTLGDFHFSYLKRFLPSLLLDICGKGYFSCKNGKCVAYYEECDGDDDCGDLSDEENCPGKKNTFIYACR